MYISRVGGQVHESAESTFVDWLPKRRAIDPLAFSCGCIGPYRLGPILRCGTFGPVHLAVSKDFDEVLEVELILIPELDESLDGMGALAARVLERLNHCVGFSHPHVAPVIGAGLTDGSPYILRRHSLGRTLSDLSCDDLRPPPAVLAGILYAAAEGLRFLEESGPSPGACMPGGIDSGNIFVGWDGSIRVLGAGFAILRDERVGADLKGLQTLAQRFDVRLGDALASAGNLSEAVQQLRRGQRSACAHRRHRVGRWMRTVDAEGCDALRRLFGMDPLQ